MARHQGSCGASPITLLFEAADWWKASQNRCKGQHVHFIPILYDETVIMESTHLMFSVRFTILR